MLSIPLGACHPSDMAPLTNTLSLGLSRLGRASSTLHFDPRLITLFGESSHLFFESLDLFLSSVTLLLQPLGVHRGLRAPRHPDATFEQDIEPLDGVARSTASGPLPPTIDVHRETVRPTVTLPHVFFALSVHSCTR